MTFKHWFFSLNVRPKFTVAFKVTLLDLKLGSNVILLYWSGWKRIMDEHSLLTSV